ncbi:hypothetical protein [Streptomyces sp. RK9]|uniref:hypothetical protein n=1 Tax=Streptomyces sp. RK9 TaxID=3239284 RepID=UPI0038707D6A
MRRTIITSAVAVLLLTGCSSSERESKPNKSTPSTASLSSKWTPKLQQATKSDTPRVCKTVGSRGCTAHLTKLTEAVYAVETALDDAGAQDSYPESVTEIRKVTRAVDRYVEDGCEHRTNLTLSSAPCAKHTQAVLSGPGLLMLALEMDELESDPGNRNAREADWSGQDQNPAPGT